MGQFARNVANTTDVGAVLTAVKTLDPSLKFDNTDGSYVNTSPAPGNQVAVVVNFPGASNANINDVAFDAAVATAQAAVNTDRTEVQQAKQAIGAIDTFLALGAPTNAQVVSEVQLLSRVCKKLIQRAL